MSVIRVENLTKTYQLNEFQVHALQHASFEIEKGEFVAIVGPSGSGKTTMLNMIGGLDQPTEGKVYIENIDMTTLTANELIDFRLRHIGFVFQAYNLIPVLTAKENVEFIMLLQERDKKERMKRAEELLTSVGLGQRMNNRPSELSGGQQQRVAVARALASNPAFVLADEPTANLDSQSAENLLDLMEDLNEEHNMTFVFSTHDPRVIQRARRVITLEDGKVKSDIRQEKKIENETV